MKSWEELPVFMRTDEVRPYWEILWNKRNQFVLKRIFDLIVAIILFIILLIPMIFIALCIKIDSPGPILYRQERVTRYGRKFRIHKFRTMVTNAEKIGTAVTVSQDSRITRVGSKLRKIRLDGNVIIGQTTESLVNKGLREVSPIHFLKGRDLYSQSNNGFHLGGVDMLVA